MGVGAHSVSERCLLWPEQQPGRAAARASNERHVSSLQRTGRMQVLWRNA